MLIKLKDRDNWVLFDRAERLQYSKRTYAVMNEKELERFVKEAYDVMPPYMIHIVPRPNWNTISITKPLRLCLACFYRGTDQVIVLAFSSLMYVCNDLGGTVEKVQPYEGS